MNVVKVVVIGGGFGGVQVASKLQRDFEVTLIDQKDDFVFTPGLPQILSDPKKANKMQISHKKFLKHGKLVVGKASVEEDIVKVNGKNHGYDFLVIATGSRPRKTNALPFKSIEDALKASELAKKGGVYVIGGGYVGVEVAAELSDITKVTLIHSRERLMHRMDPKVSSAAEKYLRDKGVKLVLGKRYKGKETAIFCGGGLPNTLGFGTDKGIDVDDFLRARGFKNVFVAGDATNIDEDKSAQNAENHAKIIVNNIRALAKKKDMKKYVSKKRVNLISLGKRTGIFVYGDLVLVGFLPAFLKKLIELRWRLRGFLQL